MKSRWAVVPLLGAGLLLAGCAGPPSPTAPAPAAVQTASAAPTAPATPAAPAAVPVSPTADPVAATSSPPELGSDQSYLADVRQHSHAGVDRDATLVSTGTRFCTQLRAGIPAKWLMDDSIKKISGMYLSGQITDAQQTQLSMDLADVDRIATKHYCPEQMTQVMAAFLQEAAAGRGTG